MKTLVIAEAGVNHNGDISLARELIDAAAEAGADMVKFQTFSADLLVTPEAEMAEYQSKHSGNDKSQYAMIKRLELGHERHSELIEYCESKNIKFFSTAFDLPSLKFLSGVGMGCFKIPSGEITNLPYLRQIGLYGKPVFLSTGMATLGEVESALAVLQSTGLDRGAITVLHCNTEYPTPMRDVNLRAMNSMRNAFDVRVGLSDHTLGIEVAVAAVAMGASVIEKHFTIDTKLPGPDHRASLEPDELALMIKSIRNIELALGDGVKRPTESELKNKLVARKSIVAAACIEKGDEFTEENIIAKRPGGGLSPMLWDSVIGRTAQRDFLPDEMIVI